MLGVSCNVYNTLLSECIMPHVHTEQLVWQSCTHTDAAISAHHPTIHPSSQPASQPAITLHTHHLTTTTFAVTTNAQHIAPRHDTTHTRTYTQPT